MKWDRLLIEGVADNFPGVVGLKRTSSTEGQVKRMAVMPEYRGQRIGQRLMSHLIYFAEEQGLSVIKLATGEDERARGLVYEPFGFVEVGFDHEHQDFEMELKLE